MGMLESLIAWACKAVGQSLPKAAFSGELATHFLLYTQDLTGRSGMRYNGLSLTGRIDGGAYARLFADALSGTAGLF